MKYFQITLIWSFTHLLETQMSFCFSLPSFKHPFVYAYSFYPACCVSVGINWDQVRAVVKHFGKGRLLKAFADLFFSSMKQMTLLEGF